MQDFINSFETNGFFVFDGFVTESLSAGILDDLHNMRQGEDFRKAGIGRESGFQVDSAQRGDFISWIDPHKTPESTTAFLEKLSDIILQLNRNFYLGIKN